MAKMVDDLTTIYKESGKGTWKIWLMMFLAFFTAGYQVDSKTSMFYNYVQVADSKMLAIFFVSFLVSLVYVLLFMSNFFIKASKKAINEGKSNKNKSILVGVLFFGVMSLMMAILPTVIYGLKLP